MRPTGRLHLGHYWGALKNWIALVPDYECYYSVADWHMLTTGYDDTSRLREYSREMVLDWLAVGLDPEKCVIFRQSDVPEHAELALLLGMVTPLSALFHNPTWKEQLVELAKTKRAGAKLEALEQIAAPANATIKAKLLDMEKELLSELGTYGFLGYPVLQAADILLYRGERVPVGQDQVPHIELSREIARRFNSIYGEAFPEPQALLTPTPKVPGLDGRKMSKSYGNALELYETQDSLKKKVMSMYTDPTKIKRDDPGHPEPCMENPPGCVAYALHKVYGTPEFAATRGNECRAGQVGCVACKKDLLSELEPPFAKFREARERYAADANLVETILEAGARKARIVAQKTMADVRRAMRLA